jgi:simple sugar transport system ATP-binding protein
MASPTPNAAIELDQIAKRFGDTIALDNATLTVRAGTVHALLGENGAGKTTLMGVAFGLLHADGGTVSVEGIPRRFDSPADAIRAGVGMVHQHYALVASMTVAENVALGLRGPYHARAAADRVRRSSAETGLALDPDARVDTLPVEAQQRVEIVKALTRDARVLILDEPTAVLAPGPAADLLRWLRAFADRGGTAILITHKLREALSIADAVTVLRHGRTVLAAPASAVSEDRLADAMLGETAAHETARSESGSGGDGQGPAMQGPAMQGPAIVTASHITLADDRGIVVISAASFVIRAGEIVGLAAVEGAGSGQYELLRALSGRRPVLDGTLAVPPDVGFVPGDRQRDALILDFPLYENIALRGAGRARGRLPWRGIRDHTRGLLAEFAVRAASDAVAASTLSGGNQQRLVLAREMHRSLGAAVATSALVVENPTRGLDLHATAAVHARLRSARAAGMAVVIYASDIDETLALADRILVLAHGTVREVPHDRDLVGRAMLGLT